MIASEQIEVGEEIVITWEMGAGLPLLPTHARVSHCTAERESCFSIGCQFKEPMDWKVWEHLVG